MRTASVSFSLLGFALGLLILLLGIANYVFDPQLHNLVASEPGTYGLSISLAEFSLGICAYPLCLIGAGFAFEAAVKRNRSWLAAALALLGVFGVATGCGGLSGGLSSDPQIAPDTPAFLLMSIPLAVPVLSVVVVAVVTFRSGLAPTHGSEGATSEEAAVSTPWPPLMSTDELWPPDGDHDRSYEYSELRLVTRSVRFRRRAGFDVLTMGDGKRIRQSEDFELPLYQSQWEGDETLEKQRAELVSSLQTEGWQPVGSVRRADVILPRFRRTMA